MGLRRRTTTTIGLVLAAMAALGLVATLSAKALGLGLAEDFLLYRWAGITRTMAGGSSALACTVFLGFAAACRFWEALKPWPRAVWAHRREIALNGATLTGSILLCLAVMELAARAIDGFPLWTTENILAKQQALLRVHTANRYDPLLGWVLRPGIRNAPGDPNASMTTGAHGVRMNRSEERPLPIGAILASGDSFTAGSEVGDAQTWPAQLEDRIGIPVVNAGTGAWATDQIVLRAEQLMPVIQPSAIVISFFSDDILRAGYRTYGGSHKPWFQVDENGRLIHHNNPVPPFTGRRSETNAPLLGHLHLTTFVLGRIGFGDWWRRANTAYVKADNDPVAVTCRLVERLHEETKERRIPLLLLLQYGGYDRLYKTAPPVHAVDVAACAAAAGVVVVDSWNTLLEVNRTDLEAFKRLYVMHDNGRVYGHMSPAGNALMAQLIETAMSPNRINR